MAWRRTAREPWSEFDEMLASMRRQFDETIERMSGAAQQMALPGGIRTVVDVREDDTDVLVVVDLPGVERQDISVRLLDPRTLRITARRAEAREEEEAGYYMRERRVGAIARTVSLPADVTGEEAHATFRNGVLEVRLKKAAGARGREIAVGGAAQKAALSAAEEQRQRKEELYREAREEVEPSGYLRPGEIAEEAKRIEPGERGTPEERATAERLRKRKEELYEEGKRKLAE
jgi:HSP20 family protein